MSREDVIRIIEDYKEFKELLADRDYWKKRCEAAERLIDESPCDPDIYPNQIKAYKEWQSLKSAK